MASKVFAIVGIALFLFVCIAMPMVSSLNIDSECLTVKHSAYEGGSLVCWREPSAKFQGIIKAEAIKLGYDPQPDGTYKKVVE